MVSFCHVSKYSLATGAENLAKGIQWCGEMMVESLRWGNKGLGKRIQPGDADAEVSLEMLRRIKRLYFLYKFLYQMCFKFPVIQIYPVRNASGFGHITVHDKIIQCAVMGLTFLFLTLCD